MIGYSRLGAMAALAAMGVAAAAPPMPVVRTPAGPKTRWRSARAPSGQSLRSLRRALNRGWEPPAIKITPERQRLYMHSTARQMAGLLDVLRARR